MADYDGPFKIGDTVTMTDFDQFGLRGMKQPAARITGFRQFQSASSDDWYWCARLEIEGDDKPRYYPCRFLALKSCPANDAQLSLFGA